MKTIKQKILVTGSAGFIGSHIFDLLQKQGHDVYGVDDLSGGFLHNVSDKKRFTKLNLCDRKKTAAYIGALKPDIIFHLAADATEGRSQFTPFSAMDRNLGAYMNLLVPAIRNGLKKIVVTSSMSVYGSQKPPFKESMQPRPQDIYGISKAAMEEVTGVLARVYGFKYVIVRPHNVYGLRQNLSDPYRNVLGIFINRLLQGKNFYIYGNGSSKRAFSHIDDVAPAMIKAAFSKACQNATINIGADKPTSLRELANVILEGFFESKNIPKEFQPEFLPDRPQEVKYAYSDHTVAHKLLGFKDKVKLRDGVQEMINWAKTMGPQKFVYLDSLELESPDTPATWKSKLI